MSTPGKKPPTGVTPGSGPAAPTGLTGSVPPPPTTAPSSTVASAAATTSIVAPTIPPAQTAAITSVTTSVAPTTAPVPPNPTAQPSTATVTSSVATTTAPVTPAKTLIATTFAPPTTPAPANTPATALPPQAQAATAPQWMPAPPRAPRAATTVTAAPMNVTFAPTTFGVTPVTGAAPMTPNVPAPANVTPNFAAFATIPAAMPTLASHMMVPATPHQVPHARTAAPRIGGVIDNVSWTGGSPLPQLASLYPATPSAMRPQDYRSSSSVYATCTAGIDSKLELANASNEMTVPIKTFQTNLWMYLVRCGMDTVFRMVRTTGEEVNLVFEYAKFTDNYKVIQDHVSAIRSQNCYFDATNLLWSAYAVRASLGTRLLEALQKFLDGSESGPELFFIAMSHMQFLSASVLRNKLNDLTNLRLRREPGENVDSFTTKMATTISMLDGAARLPEDISLIVCRCLMDCSIDSFRLVFLQCYNECNVNVYAYTYAALIHRATTMYQGAIASNEWLPGAGNRQPQPQAAQFFSNTTNATTSTGQTGNGGRRRRQRRGGNGQNAAAAPANAPNAPARNPNIAPFQPAAPHPNIQWKTTAPAANAPKQKVVNNKTFYWCQGCGRWSTTHGTAQHRNPATRPAQPPSTPNPSPPAPPTPPATGFRSYPMFAAQFCLLPAASTFFSFAQPHLVQQTHHAPNTCAPTKSANRRGRPMLPTLSFLPIAFLVFSSCIMLSMWWVSMVQCFNTGHTITPSIHMPLGFAFPSFSRPRTGPDIPQDPMSSSSTKPEPTFHHFTTKIDFPTLPPEDDLIPPPFAPTFSTSADWYDASVLDAMAQMVRQAYCTTTTDESEINETLAFHSRSNLGHVVIADTGASSSSSSYRSDFEDDTYRLLENATVWGIGEKPVPVIGVGFVLWTTTASNGDSITLRVAATHIPDSGIRLFSPQQFFNTCSQCDETSHLVTYADHTYLKIDDQVKILCPHPIGLPVILLTPEPIRIPRSKNFRVPSQETLRAPDESTTRSRTRIQNIRPRIRSRLSLLRTASTFPIVIRNCSCGTIALAILALIG